MRVYTSSKEAVNSALPPATKAAVLEAIRTLEEVFSEGFDSTERGYVVLVEKDDMAETVKDHLGRFLLRMLIEGVFVRHGCLLTVTLWGNGGEGITWICPDEDGCAPAVRKKLRDELSREEGGTH